MKFVDRIKKHRRFLKNEGWAFWERIERDQKKGLPPPPIQKPTPPGVRRVQLIAPDSFSVGDLPLIKAIARRRSWRDFSPEPLSLEELSFLLWATQGFQEAAEDGSSSFRTVPSAGARHPFETYLIVKRVSGLQPGLYRYLAVEHQLAYLHGTAEFSQGLEDDYLLFSEDALVFIWTAVPYRTEWRYSFLAHKMIAMEAGHICQNLYLAGVSIGVGVCAIGAFSQDDLDKLTGVDGEEEFAIYVARVGKIAWLF